MLRLPDDAMTVRDALRFTFDDIAISNMENVVVMTADSNVILIEASYFHTTLIQDCESIVSIAFNRDSQQDIPPIMARNMLRTLSRRFEECIGATIAVNEIQSFDYLSIID